MGLAPRKRLGFAVALLVAVVAAWHVLRVPDLAQIGAGYAAQQTCACLFVSGRSLESCETDLDPTARHLIAIRSGSDTVTARAFGVVTATARYEKGFGCSLGD
jgi:hypothetical protein